MVQLSTICCCTRMRASAATTCCLAREILARRLSAEVRRHQGSAGSARHSLTSCFGAALLDFGVAQLDLEVLNGGLRGVAIGFGGVQAAKGVGIVELGEQLAFFHASTFIKVDAGDAAGNFGGDSGAAARRNVTAGIENASRSIGRLDGSGDFHFGLSIAKGEEAAPSKARRMMGIAAQSQRLPVFVFLRLVSLMRNEDKSGLTVLGGVAMRRQLLRLEGLRLGIRARRFKSIDDGRRKIVTGTF